MTSDHHRYEFSAAEVAGLLADLDRRLRRRGVGAAIFVVGGAAIAANGLRADRLTVDVDALVSDQAVLDEATAIASERGLPADWLNPRARMWMPPLPQHALTPPPKPGLRITYADDGFLLATKLIAQRAKDADDVIALADRLNMRGASDDELDAHIRRYYTDRATLQMILDGNDIDGELRYLAEAAARLIRRPNPDPPTG
jgi:hypothetical protein